MKMVFLRFLTKEHQKHDGIFLLVEDINEEN